jgi:hypothetical protein
MSRSSPRQLFDGSFSSKKKKKKVTEIQENVEWHRQRAGYVDPQNNICGPLTVVCPASTVHNNLGEATPIIIVLRKSQLATQSKIRHPRDLRK